MEEPRPDRGREIPRTVLVTGATAGIGRRLAEAFLAHGHRVLGVGREVAALQDLAGDRLDTRRCDLADPAEIAALVADAGDIDILVNNAGVSDAAPLARTSLQSWHRQMAVNALAPFLLTRAVIEPMRARGWGRILTVASTAGRIGVPYTAAYTASKHAALGVMRVAAAELAGSGVTANAVCPTFVDTPMTRQSVERIAAHTGRSLKDSEAALLASTPTGRLLSADDVADAVLWLASDAASSVNGQALVIDGGGLQA